MLDFESGLIVYLCGGVLWIAIRMLRRSNKENEEIKKAWGKVLDNPLPVWLAAAIATIVLLAATAVYFAIWPVFVGRRAIKWLRR